jgi:hypothetical protein
VNSRNASSSSLAVVARGDDHRPSVSIDKLGFYPIGRPQAPSGGLSEQRFLLGAGERDAYLIVSSERAPLMRATSLSRSWPGRSHWPLTLRSLSPAVRGSAAAQHGVLSRTLGYAACLIIEQTGAVILFFGATWGLYARRPNRRRSPPAAGTGRR